MYLGPLADQYGRTRIVFTSGGNNLRVGNLKVVHNAVARNEGGIDPSLGGKQLTTILLSGGCRALPASGE